MSNYSFEGNTFIIEQFHNAKPFASFLPGLAGLNGIPMWTFYVNRGQAISGFGIQDKNNPIMEFSPASIAYKTVSASGFRTFLKIAGEIYEPFQTFTPDAAAKRTMRINPNEIEIEEIHEQRGLKTKVVYFHVPGESFAALVRHVEVTNFSGTPVAFELLDGIPEILPYGVENGGFKEVGHLLRSWMEVENQENLIPYYKVRSSTHDEAEVSAVNNGHFYLSFSDDGQLIRPLVDPELVFGENSSLSYPEVFAQTAIAELNERKQYAYNKVPCGFTGKTAQLDAGASLNLYTLIGHVSSATKINQEASRLTSAPYIAAKRQEANALVAGMTADIDTHTGMPVLDAYAKQCYMDNFLRGGYPFIFGGKDGQDGAVVHLFSRKHGDLERDYNFFSLLPEVYSQGNGNFRDANQNRRSDVFFNPKIGSFNIKMFFSLIQADGYNPLGVEGTTFQVGKADLAKLKDLLQTSVSGGQDELAELCSGKFTPGKLIGRIADSGHHLLVEEQQFLNEVLTLATQNIEASFNEGYWSDHWTYNLDLIDNYLDVFPDKKTELLLGDESYTFFDSPVFVLPRSEKYVLKAGTVRQYGALQHDTEKMKRLNIAQNDTNWLRTEGGTGDIYQTNLLVKLLSLSLNKFATLDPYGMGVEMEANKPGWNDAMNGLPGIVGSGMSEALELKRMVSFLLAACGEATERAIRLPEEIHHYLLEVAELAKKRLAGELDAFAYWDAVATSREAYRARIRFGITGAEASIGLDQVQAILADFAQVIAQGFAKAVELGNGLVPTYFRFEATEFQPVVDERGEPIISGYGLPKVTVKAFRAEPLPHFLEAPARLLKTVKNPAEAEEIHNRVKGTELYDSELQMFKTSVSLEGESHEIGRIRAFTAGWLERESVFLHMSYKYVLGLLKSGLYEQYAEEMQHSLVPFLDPAVYGRSTIENSSFIATTVNPDPFVRGRGFYARLTGSTAEFISMWIGMMAGKHFFENGPEGLTLALKPVLPGFLFDEAGRVSFRFLGATQVTYRNESRRNTYGPDGVAITSLKLIPETGEPVVVKGTVVTGKLAEQVRAGAFKAIDVVLS